MNYFAVVGAVNSIVALLTGLYLLFKNPKSPIHVSFASVGTSIALWSIFYTFWQMQTEEAAALWLIRAALSFCPTIVVSFLWFSKNIAEDIDRMKPPFFYWFFAIFFFFAFYTPFMIPRVERRLYFPYWPVPGPFMHLFIVWFNAIVIFSFYILIRSWRRSTGIRRWQLKWVTLSMLFTWGGGLTNWFLWYNIPIPPIPNIFVGVFLLVLAYAVIRRHLFDVDALADMVQEAKLSALGTLAAGFFHEIRNPLFVAQGHAESLREQVKGEAGQEEKVEKILNQIKRMFEIARRFSEFARPSPAGPRPVENVPVREVVEDLVSFLGHELEIEKIRIEAEMEPGTVIPFDRKHLEEILLNLFTNACQAMPKGGTLRITGGRDDGRVLLKVSDTGEGIPPDRIKRIFDPFFTTKEARGTGLGLYIVKKLVERGGGKIHVSSHPGRGTTFTLEFKVK